VHAAGSDGTRSRLRRRGRSTVLLRRPGFPTTARCRGRAPTTSRPPRAHRDREKQAQPASTSPVEGGKPGEPRGKVPGEPGRQGWPQSSDRRCDSYLGEAFDRRRAARPALSAPRERESRAVPTARSATGIRRSTGCTTGWELRRREAVQVRWATSCHTTQRVAEPTIGIAAPAHEAQRAIPEPVAFEIRGVVPDGRRALPRPRRAEAPDSSISTARWSGSDQSGIPADAGAGSDGARAQVLAPADSARRRPRGQPWTTTFKNGGEPSAAPLSVRSWQQGLLDESAKAAAKDVRRRTLGAAARRPANLWPTMASSSAPRTSCSRRPERLCDRAEYRRRAAVEERSRRVRRRGRAPRRQDFARETRSARRCTATGIEPHGHAGLERNHLARSLTLARDRHRLPAHESGPIAYCLRRCATLTTTTSRGSAASWTAESPRDAATLPAPALTTFGAHASATLERRGRPAPRRAWVLLQRMGLFRASGRAVTSMCAASRSDRGRGSRKPSSRPAAWWSLMGSMNGTAPSRHTGFTRRRRAGVLAGLFQPPWRARRVLAAAPALPIRPRGPNRAVGAVHDRCGRGHAAVRCDRDVAHNRPASGAGGDVGAPGARRRHDVRGCPSGSGR